MHTTVYVTVSQLLASFVRNIVQKGVHHGANDLYPRYLQQAIDSRRMLHNSQTHR